MATLNAQHGRSWTGRVDLEQLAIGAASLEADVIGYQEIDRRTHRVRGANLPALLASATGHEVSFANAVRVGPLGRYGIALGFRPEKRPLDSSDAASTGSPISVALAGRPGVEQRVALLARPSICGVDMVVVVAHLSPHRELGAEQFAELDELARAAGPPPHLVLADLNLSDRIWRESFATWGFAAAAAAPTFPSWQPRHRIDVVAVRGGSIVAAETRRLPVSDHRALVATLDVPASRAE